MRRCPAYALVAVAAVVISLACGCGGGSSAPPPSPVPNISVVVFPPSTTVQAGDTQLFTATVTGTAQTAVDWSVNSVPGGNNTVGTITPSGLYTAPANVPNPPTVSVTAALHADPTRSGNASVTILSPGTGQANRAQQAFPIKLGTSGGNDLDSTTSSNTITCCSGTLGALVTRGGIQYVLSNNHIIARRDQAAAGEAISQPGLVDTHCALTGNKVASFSQSAPLRTSNVDAAIAQVLSGTVDSTGAILEFGSATQPAPPASSLLISTIGMQVAKSGRSTGLTCSSIQSINTDVQVDYLPGCNSGTRFTVTFTNQVIVGGGSFSAAGDSGSLIVNSQTAQPTALLFAGSSTDSVANPIQDVLNALKDPSAGTVPSVVGGDQHTISCPAGPSLAAAQVVAPPADRLAAADAAKSKYTGQLMADPAIIAVGVGASADSPGEPAVVLYLERGKSHNPVPAELDGVRTRVIFTNRFRARVATSSAGASGLTQALSEAEVQRAATAKGKYAQRLMADPAVFAVGVGASGDNPEEAALVLYVDQAKASGVFPIQMEGVRTKIIYTDRFRAFGWNEKYPNVCSSRQPF